MSIQRLPIRKFVAPDIIFGEDSIELVGRFVSNLSGKRILLVSDHGVKREGWTDEVADFIEESGQEQVQFLDVTPNPRMGEVMKGAELYEEAVCDLIVAVGGGSPMDCAKGIGAVVSNKCHVSAFEGIDSIPIPGPPLICVPTTAGSSADVSQFAIINNEKELRKFAIISKLMVPDISLIDPEMTSTMGRRLTAATGLDALTHAIEAYVSNASSVMTDLYALEATKLISVNLVGACDEPDNMFYRERVMLGSMYAGLAFSNASLGLVHSMAHSLGGLLDAAHGECNALLLETVIDYNYPSAKERYDILSKAMSSDGKKTSGHVDGLLENISCLRANVGLDFGLSKLGVRDEDIQLLSKNAFNDPCLATNPRKTTIEDIEVLYARAL